MRKVILSLALIAAGILNNNGVNSLKMEMEAGVENQMEMENGVENQMEMENGVENQMEMENETEMETEGKIRCSSGLVSKCKRFCRSVRRRFNFVACFSNGAINCYCKRR